MNWIDISTKKILSKKFLRIAFLDELSVIVYIVAMLPNHTF